MISKIKKNLNTDIVINEKFKKNNIKILKSNIFIFFVLGTILAIIDWNYTNKDNFHSVRADYYIYLAIEFLFMEYIPFFLAIILNLIIKFSKNEKVKKVFKIIMIITNVLSVIYLLLFALMFYAVVHMFDNNSVSCLVNLYNISL